MKHAYQKGHFSIKKLFRSLTKGHDYSHHIVDLRKSLLRRKPWLSPLVAGIVVLVVVASNLRIQAQELQLYPASCLGDWSNPEQAAGDPESAQGGGVTDINASRATIQNLLLFCGQFSVSSSTLKDRQVKNIVLRPHLLVAEELPVIIGGGGSGPEENSSSTNTTSTSEINTNTSSTSSTSTIQSTSTKEIATSTTQSTSTSGGTSQSTSNTTSSENNATSSQSSAAESSESTTNQSSTPETTPVATSTDSTPPVEEAPPSEEPLTEETPPVEAPTEEPPPAEEPPPPPPPEPEPEPEPEALLRPLLEHFLRIAHASTTSSTTTPNTTTTLSISTTTNQNPTSTNDSEDDEGNIFSDIIFNVSYTTSSEAWSDLAAITHDNWRTYEVELPLDVVDDINSLRIRLDTDEIGFGVNTVVLLDGFELVLVFADDASQNNEQISSPNNQQPQPTAPVKPILKERRLKKKIEVNPQAAHHCEAETFSLNITNRSRAETTLFLSGEVVNDGLLTIGSLPKGIDVIFKHTLTHEAYIQSSSTVELVVKNQQDSQKGSFNVSILYTDNEKDDTASCQINIENF